MAIERHGERAFIPQALLQEISKTGSHLTIGIPRERVEGERRLALTPEAVARLTEHGYRVWVETGAGLGINYADNHFSEAGAEIVESAQEVYHADIILKILPPLAAEVMLMKPRTTLFSTIPLRAFSQEAYELLIAKRITAVAYELLTDNKGYNQILNAISEIEGATSIMIASNLLCNNQGGKGILLGSIPGVSPTEVVIIGAGHAGTVAARAACALGATVKVFDENLNKLRAIQQAVGYGLFTSTFHPNVLHNAFRSADVVIGTMHYINQSRRYMIATDLIRNMKRGAILIDLRINEGGCFETTCCLHPTDPQVFEQYGVLHYCKPNISNYVARTTSMAFSNVFVPLFTTINDYGSLQAMAKYDSGFKQGIYLYQGKPVNEYVSTHFNMHSNNIDIYLAAF